MNEVNFIDFLGLFLFFSGFVIGLGAVTVIDVHGFLARMSEYWTEATIRTHKVTKPLIWFGMFLAILGGIIFYREENFSGEVVLHLLIACVLVLNGLFLSFKVSPFLLRREKQGKAAEILPMEWQIKIALSFVVSFLGWWLGFGLLVFKVLGGDFL